VDQESLDDTRYNHCIIVRIILELKIFLGEGDWYKRPLGLNEGSLDSNMLYPSLCFFFYFLLAGSELEPPVIGSTSFVAEGATAWLSCEAIVAIVEVSSPEVSANVGYLFSDTMNQEQGNTIVNYSRSLSSEALSPHGYNAHQTKVKKDIPSSFNI
jgi:hypothetical protein